ncbi:glycosyltransferase family 4 protein [Maribacter hydrothermalis]|uniref:Glycosyl transferase family 1 domain-containing protein n=1 Tax=Maribacter hydrothermalis TaxID=1836467 RepID=A0A1B7ZCC4_9FLAO|nr:glycosyltransferase [Maribacter hydrothermalis]APQ18036.1 hypothetical protein BTR34_12155 [Maribacter hydrothermalis]OBR40578.1 hypothetical protein A9200_15815 [Maribacter hydrothermalis]
MKKTRLLISAFACGPHRGSEPGMGWNFVTGLSEYFEVHVITEKIEFEDSVQEYLYLNKSLNVSFYFIPIVKNDKLRKLWPPSYYWYYKDWQYKAYNLALKLDKEYDFDVIHQLNMVGYREPGYLWKINKPFVWGPIGGLENSPWSFLPTLGFKGFVFYSFRNIINLYQRNFYLRPKLATRRDNMVLISATEKVGIIAKKVWSKESVILSEVGQLNNNILAVNQRKENEPLNIVWSGLHTPGKNLKLLLRALKEINVSYKLNVLGQGEMTEKWMKIAEKYNISQNIVWHGWVKQSQAVTIMRKGHVFIITSISDLTSTVTLEALSSGLPIICLNHCGFADVVTEDCGFRISISSPKIATLEIKDAILKLFWDEKLRLKLSQGALNRAKCYSWKDKITTLDNVYKLLLENNNIR